MPAHPQVLVGRMRGVVCVVVRGQRTKNNQVRGGEDLEKSTALGLGELLGFPNPSAVLRMYRHVQLDQAQVSPIYVVHFLR